jgi:hypothetical protein
MLKKHKANAGPGWLEIGISAVLSVAIGAVLGAAYLVTKTVKKVDSIPKDTSEAAYYLEGKIDMNHSTAAVEKRKRLIEGESITLTEGEINIILGTLEKPAAAQKPAAKGAPPPDLPLLDFGPLNARLSGGEIQLGESLTYNVYGFSGIIYIRSRGTFEKRGSSFEFVPELTYVGGCPVDKIPFARDLVFRKLLFVKSVPDDVYAAWLKLVGVSIQGDSLDLKMP